MRVSGRSMRTIWTEPGATGVFIIDQTRLPHRFVTRRLASVEDAAMAIFTMQVRGAPLIGATAAYGMALAAASDPGESALLVTFFVADTAGVRLDPLAQALSERIPPLRSAELAADGRPGHPQRTLAKWGSASLLYPAAGFDYRVDNGSFFQVNRWLVDALVGSVTGGREGKLAWDLFAGVGLFARKLTERFERVVAVESALSAVSALDANLNGTAGVAVSEPTLDFLRRNAAGERPDLVVVDPPRTGLGAEIVSLLASIAAPALVYVSCDPATLARDLRALIASGYQISTVTLADLFPQTFHLETVVHLRHS